MSFTVLRLTADNFKGLTAIDITPDPDEPLVVLAGNTAQGKTSAIDSVWAALSGASASRDSGKQLRDGAKSGTVRLELGDTETKLIVERRWKEGGKPAGELTITSARGASMSSPQAFLDKLLGPLALQPEKFRDLDRATQVRTLIEALGEALPFDPKGIASDRETATVRRRDANRDAKAQTAVVAGYGEIEEPTAGVELLSAGDVLEEIRKAGQIADKFEQAARRTIDTENAWQALENEVKTLEELLVTKRNARKRAREAADGAKRHEEQDFIVPDVEPLREKLSTIEETNAEIRTWQQYLADKAKLDGLQEEAAEWDAELVKLAEVEREGLAAAAAAMPLEGLSFTPEDGVIYNGHPLKDISGREELFVCTALAMASIPDEGVRVIRIDRGESLDRNDMRELAKLADDKDIQVWITRVGDAAEGEWTISEGTATR